MNNGNPQRAHITLEAGCTLRDAADMHFALLAVQGHDGEVLVDASAVERIDTAGLQLLVAFAQSQARAGRKLGWVGVSGTVRSASARLGLDQALGLQAPMTNGVAS